MAQLKNNSSGAILVAASRGDRGGKPPVNVSIAASATETVPDDVARLPEVQALIDSGDLEVVSWSSDDDSGVSQGELKALVAAGNGTLANASQTTVNDDRVKTGSIVLLQATDGDFGALSPWVNSAAIVDGTSFQIDHGAAAGTETFNYLVIDPSHT